MIATYILILFLANGDVRIVQDLNADTCHAARNVIVTASPILYPPDKAVRHAICLNTSDPLGTP